MKRRNYSKSDDMISALHYVQKNPRSSIRKTAQKFGVSRTSLSDRIKGKYDSNSKPGNPKQGLSSTEEEGVVEFCLMMGRRGMSLTRKDLSEYIMSLVRGRSHKFKLFPSNKWFTSFRKRNPELKFRKGSKITKSRANVNIDHVRDYLKDVKYFIEEYGILPEHILNLDESPLNPEKATSKVFGGKGEKDFLVRVNDSLTATLVMVVSAAGDKFPPLFIFQGKRAFVELLNGAPDGSFLAMQDNGWINMEILENWFDDFINLLERKNNEPVLLLMDRHSSRFNLKLVEKALEKNVHILLSPPNATHLVQPLDLTIFPTIKNGFYQSVRSYNKNHPHTSITRYDLAQLIAPGFNSLSTTVIGNGFRSAGIWPPNPEIEFIQSKKKTPEPMTKKDRISKLQDLLSEKEKENVILKMENQLLVNQINALQNQIPQKRQHVKAPPNAVLTSPTMKSFLENQSKKAKEKEEKVEERRKKKGERGHKQPVKERKSRNGTVKVKVENDQEANEKEQEKEKEKEKEKGKGKEKEKEENKEESQECEENCYVIQEDDDCFVVEILNSLKNAETKQNLDFEDLIALVRTYTTYVKVSSIPKITELTFDSTATALINSTLMVDLTAQTHLFTNIRQQIFPIKTEGDGNCFYRAVSLFLTGSQERWAELKLRCANYLQENGKQFQNLFKTLDKKHNNILQELIRYGKWAGPAHITIMATMLRRTIFIYGCNPTAKPCSIEQGVGNYPLQHFLYESISPSSSPNNPIFLFHTSGYTREDLIQLGKLVPQIPNHFVPLMAKDLNHFLILHQYLPKSKFKY